MADMKILDPRYFDPRPELTEDHALWWEVLTIAYEDMDAGRRDGEEVYDWLLPMRLKGARIDWTGAYMRLDLKPAAEALEITEKLLKSQIAPYREQIKHVFRRAENRIRTRKAIEKRRG